MAWDDDYPPTIDQLRKLDGLVIEAHRDSINYAWRNSMMLHLATARGVNNLIRFFISDRKTIEKRNK
jgi:hypothetical protein